MGVGRGGFLVVFFDVFLSFFFFFFFFRSEKSYFLFSGICMEFGGSWFVYDFVFLLGEQFQGF